MTPRKSPLTSRLSGTFISLIVAGLLAACAPAADVPAADAPAAEAPAASGDTTVLSVSGAFALFPMVTVWAEQYKAAHPEVDFDIQAGGAGKGMTDVLAGAVDIAMVSREIREEETSQGAYGVPVTIDAVVGTFNAANPYAAEILAKGVTPESVNSIWITGTTTTWGQFLGTDAADAINVYTRSDAAGAAEQWVKFGGGQAQEELLGTAVNADPGVAEAVRQDPLGVGYNNIGFAYDPTTLAPIEGLQILPIDLNGDGTISDDENFYGNRDDLAEAIATGVYPSPPARVLYLVTKGEPSELILDFYRWILSEEGQAAVPGAGYIQLNAEQLAAAQELVGE
jgi:phosphate transport system substrate-binding protein